MSENGRNRMIAEVDESRSVFVAADDRLEQVIEPIRLKAGITDAMIRDMLAQMKAEADNAG